MAARGLLLLSLISSSFAACPVDTIFSSQFNKCYQYVAKATSFSLAEEYCESLGGSLVSVSNAFENSLISGIAANKSSTPFWIGINLLYYSDWSWVNGDSSTFRSWASGQPTKGSPCGSVRVSDNQWTSAVCNHLQPYMCQIDPDYVPVDPCATPPPTPIPTANPDGSCPAGHCSDPAYVLNPSTCKCYKYIPGELTYNQSAQSCADDKATMPIVLSDADNNFIANLMVAKYNHYNPWLGLYCTDTGPNSCTWQDGSPLGYSNFHTGFPFGGQYAFMDSDDNVWLTSVGSNTGSCLCQQMGIP